MTNVQTCIDALKSLVADLDNRVIDIETNLCSKIENCIRTNSWVISAITALINSLLPPQQSAFTCNDVANCINNNASVKTALSNWLSNNTNLLNGWLNWANFLPWAWVRDKIANAKFSWLSDWDYQIKKVWWAYTLVPVIASNNTYNCTPVAGSSNQSTISKTTWTWVFTNAYFGTSYSQDYLSITLLKTGSYNIACNPSVYNWSWWNVNYDVRKRTSPTTTSTVWVILPVSQQGSATGFYNPSNWNPSWTITGNAWDIFEFSFPNNSNSSYYIFPWTYPVTLSYDCSTTWVFN